MNSTAASCIVTESYLKHLDRNDIILFVLDTDDKISERTTRELKRNEELDKKNIFVYRTNDNNPQVFLRSFKKISTSHYNKRQNILNYLKKVINLLSMMLLNAILIIVTHIKKKHCLQSINMNPLIENK